MYHTHHFHSHATLVATLHSTTPLGVTTPRFYTQATLKQMWDIQLGYVHDHLLQQQTPKILKMMHNKFTITMYGKN